MSHEAFARKYRPRTFGEVVGQEAIASALRGAVHTGQLASVYLFSGSHGVGKTSMARILAKSLNCPNKTEGDPCLECPTCVSIDTGEAMDVIEIDAASNRSIEDARRIRENVLYRPQASPFKVYILDEAHQLTSHAWDALLKTFEEAPDHARFVLATTELHKVPTTIRSRAQVFHFRRATRGDVEKRLQQICEAEGVAISPGALSLVVRRARGSMRDAQKMLDQVVTLGGEGQTVEIEDVARLLGAFTTERVERLLGAISRGEAAPLLAEVSSHAQEGGQTTTFLDELTDALRAALYVQTCGRDSPLLDDFGYEPASLVGVSEALSAEGLLLALAYLVEAEQKLKLAREPRVLLEVVLVRLARARELRPLGEILERLERLEARLGGGQPLPPGGGGRGPANPGAGGQGAGGQGAGGQGGDSASRQQGPSGASPRGGSGPRGSGPQGLDRSPSSPQAQGGPQAQEAERQPSRRQGFQGQAPQRDAPQRAAPQREGFAPGPARQGPPGGAPNRGHGTPPDRGGHPGGSPQGPPGYGGPPQGPGGYARPNEAASVQGRPPGSRFEDPHRATAVMAPPRPGRQSYSYPDHMRSDAPPQQAPPLQAPPSAPQEPARPLDHSQSAQVRAPGGQIPGAPATSQQGQQGQQSQPSQGQEPREQAPLVHRGRPGQAQPQPGQPQQGQSTDHATPAALGGHLSQPALEGAWAQIQGRLGEALGIAAEALLAGLPNLRVVGPNDAELSVCLASFSWRTLNNTRYSGRIAELLSGVLGRPVTLTLARREGQPQMNQDAPGAATAGNPLYEHPLVKLAQRELDARKVM